MGRTPLLLVLAAGAPFFAANANPQERPTPPAEASATVTVSAEATPVEQAKTPSLVKVIDAQTIQRSGARTLGELLTRELPGQVTLYGGPGALNHLKLNGGREGDAVILLDGIRLNDASGLGLDLSRITMDGVERVEILQGPSSARYGAEAHAGVVALWSAGAAQTGFTGRVSAAAGTQGQRRAAAAPAYGWEGGWLRGSLQAGQEDAPTDTKRPFRTDTASLGFGQALRESGLITLTYRNGYAAAPLPYAWSYPPPAFAPVRDYAFEREYSQRNEDLIGALRWGFAPGWSGTLSLGHVTADRMEPLFGTANGQVRYTSRRSEGTGSLAWTGGAASFAFSADASEEAGRTDTGAGFTKGVGRHLAWSNGGSLDVLKDLRLSASLRSQADRIQFFDGGGALIYEDRTAESTWKLGANWQITRIWRAFLSHGTSYGSVPLASALWNQSSGGTRLNAERSQATQAGLGFAQGRWHGELAATRTAFDSLVAFDLATFLYMNAHDLKLQSAEASFGYGTSAWGLDLTARSQEGRRTDFPKGAQFQQAGSAGRPFAAFGLSGFAAFGAFRLDGRWAWQGGGYYYFDDQGAVLGSHAHFNDLALGLAWAIRKDLDLALRGEHLLQAPITRADWESGRILGRNDTYLVPGYPSQTRTVRLEAHYRF